MTEPPASARTGTTINDAAGEPDRGGGGAAQWADDLSPINASDWSFNRAAHLLERAGFGGTPEDIARLAAMSPQAAVATLVDYHAITNDHLAPFERSDVWDPSLRDFPVSRVAATERATDRTTSGRSGKRLAACWVAA